MLNLPSMPMAVYLQSLSALNLAPSTGMKLFLVIFTNAIAAKKKISSVLAEWHDKALKI